MKTACLLPLLLALVSCAPSERDGDVESGPSDDSDDQRVSYEGAQVIKLDANVVKEILEPVIEKGGVETWGGNGTHYDVYVPSNSADSLKKLLMEKNVSYTVMIDDVQRAIDVQNLVEAEEEDEFAGRKGHKMNWKSYHSLDDIYGYLDFLAETYPNQVRVGSVGNSVEGRPIKYIVISSGQQNAKKFWIDGGIHAREWISPATVTYIISELVENRERNQELNGIDFYVVPVVNPDGYEYTRKYQRLWRKNRSKGNYFCPGVDLNRNWGYKWGGLGTSNENCREIYKGTGPFSEPESRAVSNFILNNKNNMDESWKATEVQLVDKIVELEKRLSLNTANSTKEKDELNKHLKQAYDLVKKLEFELNRLKNEKAELKKDNDELTVDVMRLNCELEEHKKEYDSWATNENDKLALMESNALIQSKLSQVNTEVTKKQTEIIRLNGEIGRLRGELEKIRLGSVINHTVDSTHAVSQLQAALAMERDNSNEIAKERDCLNNEVRDLRKQVALLDNGEYGERAENANKPGTALSQRQMTAELEATRYKIELDQSRDKYVVLQNKYDRDIVELGQQIKKLQKENLSLKHLLNDQAKHQPRKTLANSKMKEDAHLLATIRGLQGELNTREKEVHRLNKELMDARKTNRRLQQEREKALNSSSSKMRGSQYGKESDALGVSRPNSGCSAQSAKDYNPLAFEDNQEAVLFLRNENRTLLEEIKRLEQDLISLHNKRIQDMSDLQEQHDREMGSMRRDHASKHSSSTVAHLQGQLYTQQMVIHHLKQQIKEYEERFEENSILKAERDHFERALMKAKQKIARLSELASPENVQYAGLLEKLEYLERRHEIREEKLQSIVRDLIAKQKKGTCSENCRDKILNKNREICYYRAEMDKILATLAEFRWN